MVTSLPKTNKNQVMKMGWKAGRIHEKLSFIKMVTLFCYFDNNWDWKLMAASSALKVVRTWNSFFKIPILVIINQNWDSKCFESAIKIDRKLLSMK